MLPLIDTDPLAIASYRLLGVLGSGGMGRVYLGESRSGRRVAIKVVRSELAADPDWRRRFEREVAAVRTVNPLFTAAVVDADTEAAEPWLATTYIDGPSLSLLVRTSGPLAPGAVLVLAAGLAEALAAIHRAGLVHRDLKPSNVIVNDEGPHIIDFGIALAADTPATTSTLLGTPSYIAPERIHGSEAHPASDIFSLGATLVFAATGRPLVTEGPIYAQLMQITTGRFDLSAVPADVRPLIERCVSLQPQTRPSADELSRVLGAARVPSPSPGWYAAVEPVVAVPVVPPPRRFTRRRLLVAGGVVVGAAAVSGVATLLPALPPEPRAYAMPQPSISPRGGPPPPPPPPPKPGDIVWQAASGARPLPPSPGDVARGSRIIVDGERIISANGPEISAVSPAGHTLWRTTLPAGLVTLRRWGDAVLINDARRLWLFGLDGTQRWAMEAAADEEALLPAADNTAVQVSGVALTADRAYVGLGPAVIAVDRTGAVAWRKPRPRLGTEIHPQISGPVAGTSTWVLAHHVRDGGAQAALRSAETGDPQWSAQYDVPSNVYDQPPGPPGGGPGGPRGPGGNDGPPMEDELLTDEGRIGEEIVVLREAKHITALRLSNGSFVWERTVPSPVVGIEIMGDQLLIAADRLVALSLANAAERWQLNLHQARLAVTPDGQIVAAAEGRVACFDAKGIERWSRLLPPEVSDVTFDEVTADLHTAYVTLRARGQRNDQLPVDVLAFALDAESPRPPR